MPKPVSWTEQDDHTLKSFRSIKYFADLLETPRGYCVKICIYHRPPSRKMCGQFDEKKKSLTYPISDQKATLTLRKGRLELCQEFRSTFFLKLFNQLFLIYHKKEVGNQMSTYTNAVKKKAIKKLSSQVTSKKISFSLFPTYTSS